SRFYLSLEDNLIRIFAGPTVQKMMTRLGLQEDDIIESPLVTRQIAGAQRKVESHNFDIRKNLLDFDDVNNDQRKVIYQQRDELLESDSVSDNIAGIRGDVVAELVDRFVPPDSIDEQWDLPGLEAELQADFGLDIALQSMAAERDELDAEAIAEHVQQAVDGLFEQKEAQVGGETMRMLEKHLMLNVLDQNWKEHLARMDYLRQGIHLRGYAQKQPKQEYKREAFELFSQMLEKVKHEVVATLARVRVRTEQEVADAEAAERARLEAMVQRMQFRHPDSGAMGADEEAADVLGATDFADRQAALPKVGRNEACPCGSGKKYKHCHGQLG
ncbi:MAG: SEC-C metal-binding domain-containing protein, partial [Pseudoxanthomonas suwonensis]|nr:SEC-C metal-binding domain-containing protein [Pseudoxanthomonas suwonensis]